MRRTILALVAAGSLSLVSACGTSGGNDADATTTAAGAKATTTESATTTTEAAAEDVDTWAMGFCGSFSTWLDGIKAASNSVSDKVTPGDPESAKTAIVDLFGTASDETRTLISAIEDGGTPDIEDGQGLVDLLVEKFHGFDDAALAAKADAENLDPTSPSVQSDVSDLTTTFQDEVNKVGDSFSEIDAKYPSPELNKALTTHCSF